VPDKQGGDIVEGSLMKHAKDSIFFFIGWKHR
jgi:hypothetical protein